VSDHQGDYDYDRGYAEGYRDGRASAAAAASLASAEAAAAHADALIDARLDMHDEVLGLIARERDRAIRSGASTTEIMTIRAILERVRTMMADTNREENET
jgi:hypothetical protein